MLPSEVSTAFMMLPGQVLMLATISLPRQHLSPLGCSCVPIASLLPGPGSPRPNATLRHGRWGQGVLLPGSGVCDMLVMKTPVAALLPEVCATSVVLVELAPAMAVASSLDQVFSEYPAALDLMTGHCVEWAGPGSLPSLDWGVHWGSSQEHSGLSALLATQHPHTPLELSLGFSSLSACLSTSLSSQDSLFFLPRALGLGYPVCGILPWMRAHSCSLSVYLRPLPWFRSWPNAFSPILPG